MIKTTCGKPEYPFLEVIWGNIAYMDLLVLLQKTESQQDFSGCTSTNFLKKITNHLWSTSLQPVFCILFQELCLSQTIPDGASAAQTGSENFALSLKVLFFPWSDLSGIPFCLSFARKDIRSISCWRRQESAEAGWVCYSWPMFGVVWFHFPFTELF